MICFIYLYVCVQSVYAYVCVCHASMHVVLEPLELGSWAFAGPLAYYVHAVI